MTDKILPEGWEWKRLQNILDHVIGGDWGKDIDEEIEGEWLQVKCIRGSELKNWDKEKGATAALRKIKKSSLDGRKLQIGDIILEISGGGPDQPVGRTVLIDNLVLSIDNTYPKVCTNFFRLLRPSDDVDSNFLNYYLTNFYLSGEVVKYQGGSNNLRNLKFKEFEQIPIPIPPLSEQQRIAARLDALMGQLEKAKSALPAFPDMIKSFRQAVLAQAVSGRLTEDWRGQNPDVEKMLNSLLILSKKKENIYNKELLEYKIKQTKKPNKDFELDFDSHPLIKNWAICKLENLIYLSGRIGWKGLKADEYTEFGPLFLSVHSLNYGENVNYDVAYHITEERYLESPEIMLKENDILLCKDGAGIGKLGIVKDLNKKATVNSSLLVIRTCELVDYKYLYYFLAGPSLQNIAKERITGTAIPHLFQKDIREFRLEIPPLLEQEEIVRRVERLFAYADSLEQQHAQLKEKLELLPQTILAKAFRGEI